MIFLWCSPSIFEKHAIKIFDLIQRKANSTKADLSLTKITEFEVNLKTLGQLLEIGLQIKFGYRTNNNFFNVDSGWLNCLEPTRQLAKLCFSAIVRTLLSDDSTA